MTAVLPARQAGSMFPRMRISARNQLAGQVVAVEHGTVMSTVVIRLEGGQEVVSAITKDSAENLELAPGDPVIAVIKSTEVMVAKEP
jgi:molybdopterin-binding protein